MEKVKSMSLEDLNNIRNDKAYNDVLRREIDKQFIGTLEAFQSTVLKIGELAPEVSELKEQVALIKGDIKSILQRFDEVVIPKLELYNKTLYGNPELAGQGGVIGDVNKLKSDIRDIKTKFTLFITSIVSAINFIISFIVKKFL